MIVGTAFAARQWIGDILAKEANSRLEDAGVYLTWEDANWIPGPGVTLSGVILYRDADKKDPAVKVSHLSLLKDSPGWKDWSAGRFVTRGAQLELFEGGTHMGVQNFGVDLHVEQGRVEVVKAEGLMEGWSALITGEYSWTPRSLLSDEEQAQKPVREKGQGLKSALRFRWLAPTQRYIKVTSQGQPPIAHLDFRKAQPEDRVKMNLELKGGDFTWRNLHLTEVAAKIDTAAEGDPWSRIEIPYLKLGSGGGAAEMAAHIEPGKEHMVVQKLDSTLDLPAVIRQLFPNSTHLNRLKSEGVWKLNGTGVLPFGEPAAMNWEGTLALDGSLDWQMESGSVHISDLRSHLVLKDQKANLTDLRAGLWGGSIVSDQLDLDYSKPGTTFKTTARLSGASLQQVMRSFGSDDSRPGVLTGTWSGGGGFSPADLKGSGGFTISQARFYQVPLLGALHILINPLQPEFGKDVASKLDARYRISDGLLTFDSLDLESQATHVNANGRINLVNKQAHFEAKARLRGLVLRLATGAFSELLAFEGDGVMPDLKWQLKFAPGTQVVRGTLDAATGILKGGAKLGVGAAEGVLEGTGKAAKELFKLPGRLIPGRKD